MLENRSETHVSRLVLYTNILATACSKGRRLSIHVSVGLPRVSRVFVLSQRWRGIWFLSNWQTEMDECQAEPHRVAREGWGVERKGEGISLIWRWTAGWMNKWVKDKLGETKEWLISSIYIQLAIINMGPFIKPASCAIFDIWNKSLIVSLNWLHADRHACSPLECFKQPFS